VSWLDVSGALLLGVAFGFAMQRGGFCGASLLSSVVLFRERKGLVAIAVAILVSMVGFAVLAQLGWVIPNPQPMRLLSAVVGGLLFGVGMVFAGGCATGTLYKAGEGRLTSMLALLTMGAGAVLVDQGALAGVKRSLVVATKEIRWFAGLHDGLGLDYPPVAAVIGMSGLAAVGIVALIRRRGAEPRASAGGPWLSRGWSPITAGAVIGVLGWLAYLSSAGAGRNYPLGGIGGVKSAFSWVVSGEAAGSTWMILLVAGIIVGSAVSAGLRRQWKLRSADPATLLMALLGGLLVGAGAAIGRGCFIGNQVSGLALLSLHSAIFAVCMVLANWVTTLLYLRGIR
jgi:uncharacterized protein